MVCYVCLNLVLSSTHTYYVTFRNNGMKFDEVFVEEEFKYLYCRVQLILITLIGVSMYPKHLYEYMQYAQFVQKRI